MSSDPSPSPSPRVSIFKELIELDDEMSALPAPLLDTTLVLPQSTPLTRPLHRRVRFRSKPDVLEPPQEQDEDEWEDVDSDADVPKNLRLPTLDDALHTPPVSGTSRLFGLSALLLALAAALPLVQTTALGRGSSPFLDSPGRMFMSRSLSSQKDTSLKMNQLSKRQYNPTNYCTRWAQQSAVVNGTLYLYGGQASSQQGQTDNTWNNDFLSLDLTNTWQISSPALSALPQPSGPPAVSLGYLWNSMTSLFLYGGEFSSSPPADPTPFTLWEYDIPQGKWNGIQEAQTSQGDQSDGGNQPVQRVAEGAGAMAPLLGRGWYFGGHEDGYTTDGWSQSVPRIYIKSMIEYTLPGFTNNGVQSLAGGSTAGSNGTWRNITGGGENAAGFPERADGLLMFVPGFGAEGVLLGLSGGTNQTFTEMNEIDVFDIATSTWYKQATSGPTPEIRVDACSVVAAAPDGSSYNVYMYGGQNLQPAGNQTQYSDMWVLTIPAFTWISVDTNGQSVPPGRAGHTCNIWDGQMVVVGGYVGPQLSCDSPGIYVFDLSKLEWVNQFTATSPKSSSSGSNQQNNPLNQQPAQVGTKNTSGLIGSFGYSVPQQVFSVIGGTSSGGATVTAPAATATGGPLATGKPDVYTTSAPGPFGTGTSSGSSNDRHSTNVGAIVAGVVAGVLALIAGYLAFCAYLYRKQLGLYKRHVAAAQRAAATDPSRPEMAFFSPTSAAAGGAIAAGAGGAAAGALGTDSPRDSTNGPYAPQRPRFFAAGESSNSGGDSGYSGSHNRAGYVSLQRRPSESGSRSSGEDLLAGNEPSFWGTALNPRKTLQVVNRD